MRRRAIVCKMADAVKIAQFQGAVADIDMPAHTGAPDARTLRVGVET